MKVVIATTTILLWTSVSVASICFSTDEVDAFASSSASSSAKASAASSQATGGPIAMAATNAPAPPANRAAVHSAPALVLASQSMGVAGSAGTSNGMSPGAGGSGGGGRRARTVGSSSSDDAIVVASADEGISDVGAMDMDAVAVESVALEAGAAEAGAVSMPEPSMAVVWGVLLVCGLGVASLRRK